MLCTQDPEGLPATLLRKGDLSAPGKMEDDLRIFPAHKVLSDLYGKANAADREQGCIPIGHLAVFDDDGTAVQLIAPKEGSADDNGNCEPFGEGADLLHAPGGGFHQHRCSKQVTAGAAGKGKFRKSQDGNPLVSGPLNQRADLPHIGLDIGKPHDGRRRGYPDKSVCFHNVSIMRSNSRDILSAAASAARMMASPSVT